MDFQFRQNRAYQGLQIISGLVASVIMSCAAIDAFGELPPNPGIPDLLRQLDCDQFEARAEANAALVAIGPVVIPPLLEAMAGDSSVELQIRGCMVLKSFAMSSDEEQQRLGREALENLAAQKSSQAGQIARLALEEISWLLYRRATERLTSLGAVFSYLPDQFLAFPQGNPNPFGMESARYDQVTFGEEWNGTPADLALLRDLPTVVDFICVGPKMTDAYFQQLRHAASMRRLICYQCNLTHAGLSGLVELKNLTLLAVGYSPIGKPEVEQLLKLRSLRQASLFGTGIDSELIEQLRRGENFRAVDVRGGAFMGISPMTVGNDATTPGVIVSDLAPNSPGEQAGLMTGDMIMSIDGEEINDFDQLRQAIGKHKPGKSVVLKGSRNGIDFEKEVELAPWSVEDWKRRLPFDENDILNSIESTITPPEAVPNLPK